jgi:hypothetical protein
LWILPKSAPSRIPGSGPGWRGGRCGWTAANHCRLRIESEAVSPHKGHVGEFTRRRLYCSELPETRKCGRKSLNTLKPDVTEKRAGRSRSLGYNATVHRRRKVRSKFRTPLVPWLFHRSGAIAGLPHDLGGPSRGGGPPDAEVVAASVNPGGGQDTISWVRLLRSGSAQAQNLGRAQMSIPVSASPIAPSAAF